MNCKQPCEKLANSQKYNVERRFQDKQTAFAGIYQAGDETQRVILKLLRKAEQSKHTFKKWMKPPNST